jgi:hypothetical protein
LLHFVEDETLMFPLAQVDFLCGEWTGERQMRNEIQEEEENSFPARTHIAHDPFHKRGNPVLSPNRAP